jgi:hypothetical protein
MLIEELEKLYEPQTGEPVEHNRISWSGNCMRKNYYKRIGEYISNPSNSRGLRTFDAGNMQEDYIVSKLTEAGVRVICPQTEVVDFENNTIGHIDRYVQRFKALLEIKSINRYSFDALTKYLKREPESGDFYGNYNDLQKYFEAANNPLQIKKNYQQPNYYFALLKDERNKFQYPVEQMILFFVCKDTMRFAEITVDEVDEELLAETRDEFKQINDCVDNNIIPKRKYAYPTEHEWECQYCAYNKTCWKGFVSPAGNEVEAVVEDLKMVEQLERYSEIKSLEKEAKDIQKSVKAYLYNHNASKLLAGDHYATLSKRERTSVDTKSLPDDVKEKFTKTSEYEVLNIK